jgi:glycosyltransferase involved in cell wall biosynthesis
MPNILYVIPNLNVGGTEFQLGLLARALVGTDYVPHILCLGEEGTLADSLRKAGVEIEAAGIENPQSCRVKQKVKWFCKDWNIDLVHTLLPGTDLPAVRGAAKAGVRAIITSRREIPDWKKGSHLRAQRMANKLTQRVICNSHAVEDFIRSQEGLSKEKTRVIHNGFPEETIPSHPAIAVSDRKREALRSLMIHEDEFVLTCIANFNPVKNHRKMLEGLRKVLLKGLRVRMVLVGEGPLLEETRQFAEEHTLGIATEFLGSRLDRLKILAESDAVILASLNEGFPNAVLEAQAIGVPVIASRVGGIPELIDHGNTGWLFDPRDANSIAGAIWTVLQNENDALRVARLAQDIVRKKFTVRNMVANYRQQYDELLVSS